jgi:type II secretory pathway component PulF
MPKFRYRAKKSPTEFAEGEIEAPTREAVVGLLTEQGLVPVTVAESGAKAASAGSPSARIRQGEVDIFFRQLASLLKARVPILRSLSLISGEIRNPAMRALASDLETRVRDGEMLSSAMGRYPRAFDNFALGLVRAGERGGMLGEMLRELAAHRERENEIRRKIQAALLYPALVTVAGIGAVAVSLAFFLPNLLTLFKQMKDLPLPTLILINLSNFSRDNYPWFLLALAFVFALFRRMRPGGRKKWVVDLVKLHTPVVRGFVLNADLAKFSRTLALLIRHGVSVQEGVPLARDTLDNEVLRKTLSEVTDGIIRHGARLSDSLRKVAAFPPFVIQMIAVGEEGGSLVASLEEVADVYGRRVEHYARIMTGLLEPLLILLVGCIVGFMVFAMLLPIFEMGEMGL